MYTDTAAPAASRRLVMLADNGVDGDSRVQKQARSAAEAGWDVTVLGVARGRDERRWDIGGASVRLLYVAPDLRLRPREFQAPLRTRLLAYPPGRLARFRAQQLAALRADLAVRPGVWALVVRCLLVSAWVGLRLRHTRLLTAKAASGGVRVPGWARKAVRRRPWLRRLSWLAAPMRLWQHASAASARRRKEGRTWWDRVRLWAWTSTFPRRGWRWLHPYLWSYELVFGPVVDELAPDLVHANDFRMIGVAARAKLRAQAAGRTLRIVWDAHEYLPGIKPPADPRWLPAMCAHESEYARHADTVVTVSEELASLLQARHRLPTLPRVVLNAPDISTPTLAGGDIRAMCGLGAEDRLLVYSGAAAEQRGLRIMVQSLPALPGVHVAFVVPRTDAPFVLAQVALAERLGVADRLHVLPYVPHEAVVPFLGGADAGVIPIHHWPNHEIALITKFFEYSHARLPLVVSDVRTIAATVVRTGQGEVFTAEDIVGYRRAVEAVLADPGRYRGAYAEDVLADWTWGRQAGVLLEAYEEAWGQSACRGWWWRGRGRWWWGKGGVIATWLPLTAHLTLVAGGDRVPGAAIARASRVFMTGPHLLQPHSTLPTSGDRVSRVAVARRAALAAAWPHPRYRAPACGPTPRRQPVVPGVPERRSHGRADLPQGERRPSHIHATGLLLSHYRTPRRQPTAVVARAR